MAQRQAVELSCDSRLYFPTDIVIKEIGGGRYLCVSIKTANWIIVNTSIQIDFLNQLMDGKMIQDVMETINNEDFPQFLQLLSCIMARRFASLEKDGIVVTKEDNSKSLYVFLTQACNLRCKHCFMNSGVKLTNELNPQQWKNILSEFRNLKGEFVTFTGGEPLMNPYFEDIVRHASDIGLKVTVLTNGLLWNNEIIERMYGYIDQIQVSLDGVDESTNAAVRGKGHFNKIIDNILKLSNRGYRTSVATTFTLENLTDNTKQLYADLVEKLKNQSKTPIFFKITKKMLNGRNTTYSQEEAEEYFAKAMEIERTLMRTVTNKTSWKDMNPIL